MLIPWKSASGITCGDLVGMALDHTELTLRQECARWLGLTTPPAQVEGSYMEECYNDGSLIRYRHSVCCSGTYISITTGHAG